MKKNKAKQKNLTLLGLGWSLQTADRKKIKILVFKWSLFLLLYSYTQTTHIAFCFDYKI